MDASLTFVGTATTVLRLGRHTLLTDPNFLHRGQRADLGYGLSSPRLTEPSTTIADLPRLDGAVVASARRPLRRCGPPRTRPRPADRHHADGGPALLHRLLPSVTGSIVDFERRGHRSLRIYITGDTLNVPALRDVRERFPDIDVMIAHLGGTRIAGVLVTMDATRGADLVDLIRPGAVVPVYFDDYGVVRSPLTHFTDEMRRRGTGDSVRYIVRGETAPLPARPVPDRTSLDPVLRSGSARPAREE